MSERRVTRQTVKPTAVETIHDKILRLSGLSVDEVVVSKTLQSLLEHCSKQIPSDAADRLMPFFALHTNNFTIDDCDFTKSIKSIRVLTSEEKSSASSSWIMFGKIENVDVALKLHLLPRTTEDLVDDNSLEIEHLIYRRVINPLIACGFTPHVVAYYGELFCDKFVETLNNKISQGDTAMLELATELQKSREVNPNDNRMPPPFTGANDTYLPKLNIDRMRALISEKVVGTQFEDMLRKQPHRATRPVQNTYFTKLYLPVLFQVFYTLAAFADVGLVHNDLHAGNVFVEKYKDAVENCYFIGGQLYKITSQYQSRIFDFDRGAKLSTAFDNTELRNTLLSRSHYCDNFGQCQSVDERRELFTFCYFTYRYNKGQNIYLDALLAKIVPIELLVRQSTQDVDAKDIKPGKTLAWSGRLCACKDRRCKDCVVIDDPRILTPKEIVLLPEFDVFSIKPSQVGNTFIWALPSEAANNAAQRFKIAAK